MPLDSFIDVRAQMPHYDHYKDWQRPGDITGIAIHHSATANPLTGEPTGDAFSFFDYHVNRRGWAHGGYNYVITGQGVIQYALDDKIAAYHAGFKDPGDSAGLEQGQFWNNHYLAVCVAGWFSDNRVVQADDGPQAVPNHHTRPNQAQMTALIALLRHLMQRYGIAPANVRAHRELTGNHTQCPGLNLDPAQIRRQLPEPEPPSTPPQPELGQHLLLVPDTGDYLSAALGYIWKFQPDVRFAAQNTAGSWPIVTAVGNIASDLLADWQSRVAFFQHIPGDAPAVQSQLDGMVQRNQRFLPAAAIEARPATYTVQPGDTLSHIARLVYDNAGLWPIIFEANRDSLSDPGELAVGQVLEIPPKP